MKITRRKWLRQAAGTAAAAGVASLLRADERFASDHRDNPEKNIAGAGSLKAHAAARGLLTGAAVNTHLLHSDVIYRQVLAEQSNILVGENCMKFGPTHPKPDTYFFNDADGLVSFAETTGMKVRGHNFVWHEALPEWFAGTVTSENAKKSSSITS